MSSGQPQFQFAAEFLTLVISASSLALVLFRQPGNRTSKLTGRLTPGALRFGTAVSLVAMAVVAFLRGSLLLVGDDLRWTGVARLAFAVVLLPLLPAWWTPGERVGARLVLAVGIVFWAAGGLVQALLGPGPPTSVGAAAEPGQLAVDSLIVVGSLAVAVSVGLLSRESIALKVVGGAATTVLLVVVVLAVALTAVISSEVEHDRLVALAARAGVERQAASDTSSVATDAKLLGADLQGDFGQVSPNPLVEFGTAAGSDRAGPAQAASLIGTRLKTLRRIEPSEVLAYSDPTGSRVIEAGSASQGVADALAGDQALNPHSCTYGEQGLFVGAGTTWVAASYPECTDQGQDVGLAFVAVPLDTRYLATRQAVDPSVSLALISGGHMIAGAGTLPGTQALQAIAGLGSGAGQIVTRVDSGRFVGVVRLPVASGQPAVTLVLSQPTTSVGSATVRLYRALFLIALGATVLALGLAIFVGDRITGGLRSLTSAALAPRSGGGHLRTAVRGDDEVASLGIAFDSMLDSVAAQASALRAAADEEARLRNRMEAVVAGMSDALVALDGFGRITDINLAAVRLLGAEAEGCRGERAIDVVKLSDDIGRVMDLADLDLGDRIDGPGGPAPATFTGVIQRSDGVEVPVGISAGAMGDVGGSPGGRVFVLRDLRAERQVERMKTEFLSRVGHELRTPLTGIIGFAEILSRRQVEPERARAWHHEILLSARRQLRIVEMLEFFASAGAGRLYLRPVPLEVAELLQGLASEWSKRLPSGFTMETELEPSPIRVLADERWTTLAFDELIDNAVKFSPEGGRLLLRGRAVPAQGPADGDLTAVARSGRWVEISVQDEGMGMTAEDCAALFEDFAQGDTTDTRRFGGLGLGLAVVRRVVEAQGGTVSGRSALGHGSVFTIRLEESPAGLPA